jgi:hypothetical protein
MARSKFSAKMNQTSQEPCELAEVVYEKPLSGAFEEVLFGSDRGNILWVKFSDKDGVNEWIGKFGDGHHWGSRRVTKVAEPDRFFVSAGGFAYLIDATTRKLVSQYCKHNVLDVAYDGQKNLLIVADYKRLNWVEFDGKTLFSKNVAVDGIRDLKVESRILSGLAIKNYGDEEKRFKFDLDKLEIVGWEKLPSTKPKGAKAWWKFW